MKRENQLQEKNLTNVIYHEYLQHKLNKYKLQFPIMSQSNILAKIHQEWDKLITPAKKKFQKIYEKNKLITLKDILTSENSVSNQKKSKKALQSRNKKVEESSSLPVVQKTKLIIKSYQPSNDISARQKYAILQNQNPHWTSGHIASFINRPWRQNGNGRWTYRN